MDVPDEVIDALEGDAWVWYTEKFDPWCESLRAAAIAVE